MKTNKNKTKKQKIPGQVEKLVSHLHQVKQSFRQIKKSSDRANLTRLSPEALQIQYDTYGLSLAVTILYYRATWLHNTQTTYHLIFIWVLIGKK